MDQLEAKTECHAEAIQKGKRMPRAPQTHRRNEWGVPMQHRFLTKSNGRGGTADGGPHRR